MTKASAILATGLGTQRCRNKLKGCYKREEEIWSKFITRGIKREVDKSKNVHRVNFFDIDLPIK
jgi:hypothetical protein